MEEFFSCLSSESTIYSDNYTMQGNREWIN